MSALNIMDPQRPIGFSGFVDGILIGEGYTQCDFSLAAFLQAGEDGEMQLEVPGPLASGRLDLDEERIARLKEIRQKQNQYGTEFMSRYKDPQFLGKFLADGVKGWMNFNIRKELEAHLGREITKESYEELMNSHVGMITPAIVTCLASRVYQQIDQTAGRAFGSIGGKPLSGSFGKEVLPTMEARFLEKL